MDEGLRAGLLFFALLSALGAVPVLVRRLRPAALLALHLLGMSALLALVLTAQAGGPSGRGVLAPYAVALALALLVGAGPAGRDVVKPMLRWAALPIAVFGLAGSVPQLSDTALGRVLDTSSVILAAAFAGVTCVVVAYRARTRESRAQAAADHGAAASAGLAALGMLGLALPGATGLGAVGLVALGAAGALATSVRTQPFVGPTSREFVSAAFIALATAFALVAARGGLGGLVLAAQVGLTSLGVLAVTRPLLQLSARLPVRLRERLAGGVTTSDDGLQPRPAIADGALAHVTPILDDAFVRRLGGPRVNARISAKRLLESALNRAGGARPSNVEVREDGADVDVEGDPGELAEALSAILDNALGLKSSYPKLYIRVHVRGSAGHVTFEVSDDLQVQAPSEPMAAADAPFSSARALGERPGLGVGLARARLIAERHGGTLLLRRTKEGSCVQLTLPRRRQRARRGYA